MASRRDTRRAPVGRDEGAVDRRRRVALYPAARPARRLGALNEGARLGAGAGDPLPVLPPHRGGGRMIAGSVGASRPLTSPGNKLTGLRPQSASSTTTGQRYFRSCSALGGLRWRSPGFQPRAGGDLNPLVRSTCVTQRWNQLGANKF